MKQFLISIIAIAAFAFLYHRTRQRCNHDTPETKPLTPDDQGRYSLDFTQDDTSVKVYIPYSLLKIIPTHSLFVELFPKDTKMGSFVLENIDYEPDTNGIIQITDWCPNTEGPTVEFYSFKTEIRKKDQTLVLTFMTTDPMKSVYAFDINN